MSSYQERCISIKTRMLRLGIQQISLVNLLIEKGICTEDKRFSMTTTVNLALNCKRTTKRYESILCSLEDILDDLDKISV